MSPAQSSPPEQPTGGGSQNIPNYGATSSSSNQPVPKSKASTNPSKIEPKVWLANERTWLNWCRTGLLLGTFGIALVNCSVSFRLSVVLNDFVQSKYPLADPRICAHIP